MKKNEEEDNEMEVPVMWKTQVKKTNSKKIGLIFLSFKDDDIECLIRRHFLIVEVASKSPKEHVNLPK